MKVSVVGAWSFCAFLLSVVSTNAWRTSLSHPPLSKFSRMRWQSATKLLAKKKSLISEDLYASFDLFDDDESNAVKDKNKNTPSHRQQHVPQERQQPQLHHSTKQNDLTEHVMDELLRSVKDIDNEPSAALGLNGKGGKKNKNRNRPYQQLEDEEMVTSSGVHISASEATLSFAVDKVSSNTPLIYQNKHQKQHQQSQKDKAPTDQTRKDKPNSKVRFSSDSTQPDFVSMGLEKVSLVFGDVSVLRDATFSVSTGERVGLVGPNGGGKVSLR